MHFNFLACSRLTDRSPGGSGGAVVVLAFYFDLRASPSSPATVATTPPTNIHIALSVGEPVKKRETSEPSEFDALKPKIISRMPPARSASESGLFMFFRLYDLHCAASQIEGWARFGMLHKLCTAPTLTRSPVCIFRLRDKPVAVRRPCRRLEVTYLNAYNGLSPCFGIQVS